MRNQFNCLRELKTTLGEEHAYISMDFSNNYQTMDQDEVQAAFFACQYLEVFTCIAYVGSNPHKTIS